MVHSPICSQPPRTVFQSGIRQCVSTMRRVARPQALRSAHMKCLPASIMSRHACDLKQAIASEGALSALRPYHRSLQTTSVHKGCSVRARCCTRGSRRTLSTPPKVHALASSVPAVSGRTGLRPVCSAQHMQAAWRIHTGGTSPT